MIGFEPHNLTRPPRSFHVMTKPIGPICNLDCKYCFYLEKEKLYPTTSSFRMSDDVLRSYIRQYIQAQDVTEVNFAWQGGEPTLMGLDFFRRVLELQQEYCPAGKTVSNALQTNGTLLDDEWCSFLARNGFLVGISIDGPRELHDRYRVDKGGKPTFERVMRGLELLKKHGVEFNTLTVVNHANMRRPLEVYRFLKSQGSSYIQFIPLVERTGLRENLLEPGTPAAVETESAVTPWSVEPAAYGQFLCEVFDEWVRRDVGKVYVQLFDVQLGIWLGMPSALCVFAETCGRALAIEHNGDLYSCDHYVYPRHRLGNILEQPMAQLVDSPQQQQFGKDKADTLPRYCRDCEVRFACNGECPKHRFLHTPDGEPGLNYLCAGYKRFLHHIAPRMEAMADLVRRGRPAAEIMARVAREETGSAVVWNPARRHQDSIQADSAGKVGRNSPCPCGSGLKFKKCCGE